MCIWFDDIFRYKINIYGFIYRLHFAFWNVCVCVCWAKTRAYMQGSYISYMNVIIFPFSTVPFLLLASSHLKRVDYFMVFSSSSSFFSFTVSISLQNNFFHLTANSDILCAYTVHICVFKSKEEKYKWYFIFWIYIGYREPEMNEWKKKKKIKGVYLLSYASFRMHATY